MAATPSRPAAIDRWATNPGTGGGGTAPAGGRDTPQVAVAARCGLGGGAVVEAGEHGVQVGALGQRVGVGHAVGGDVRVGAAAVVQAVDGQREVTGGAHVVAHAQVHQVGVLLEAVEHGVDQWLWHRLGRQPGGEFRP